MQVLKIGSDFSGVGAFDYAIKRVANAQGFGIENVFACDMDKFARQSYLANHDAPGYYPVNVYDREIPNESLDIYMTSPPCQAFSLIGRQLGKNDQRGILFFNSLEFIRKNNPRFFIFENVKGLMSDDNGKTFSEWINFLGGKSVNNNPVLFPYDDCVPYHIYFDVLNAKEHGIPQNRERVFIIGIRDDIDNNFRFPKTEHLTKKLMDVLESDVDEKYFLSDKMLNHFLIRSEKNKLEGNGFKFEPTNGNSFSKCITTKEGQRMPDNFIFINTKNQGVFLNRIRRLTPRECFRLMDFPDEFKFVVSNNQLIKQAGNSIVVRVLEKIISNLNLIKK